MPEKTGTITGLIKKRDGAVFGLNIDGSEYLYSFPEYRGEPFQDVIVAVGLDVRIEYQNTEKSGKTKSYISVLEVLDEGPTPPEPTYDDERTTPYGETQQAWGFHQKDVLVFIESCAKGACTIYAAALAGGQLKEMPKGDEVTSLARVLEGHGTERFKALMEDL